MKTYKFKYAKLVRDRIPEKIKKSGGQASQKILSESQYIVALKNKLIEEGKELVLAKKPEDLLDELADIQEIIDNLLIALKSKAQDLKKIQKEKNKKNGSFRNKVYINHITVNETFDWLEYHLKNKDKYPLIK